jgi:biotin synthase-related radical SAM superfamily protein
MRKEGREWIEIKVGTKLIAVDDYEETLIIGKEYEVLEVDECNFDFTVKSELHNIHTFDFEDAKGTIFKIKEEYEVPKHYDNTNGSLYLFAEQHKLNAWEFDCIKRIVRSRKKGNFIEDINKTIVVLELYKKEYES